MQSPSIQSKDTGDSMKFKPSKNSLQTLSFVFLHTDPFYLLFMYMKHFKYFLVKVFFPADTNFFNGAFVEEGQSGHFRLECSASFCFVFQERNSTLEDGNSLSSKYCLRKFSRFEETNQEIPSLSKHTVKSLIPSHEKRGTILEITATSIS